MKRIHIKVYNTRGYGDPVGLATTRHGLLSLVGKAFKQSHGCSLHGWWITPTRTLELGGCYTPEDFKRLLEEVTK
jgi:hypothetical protein